MSSSALPNDAGDAGSRPTRVRHLVVTVAVLMAVLLYLDRFCVSFAERYIKQDLHLSESETAWFISLFFWSYALGQVPCGWLGDRFGVRGVLASYILAWSLFTALIGFSGGIISLLVMRLGCGLAQAGAFPACGNLLSKWIPLANRGQASALVALGGRIGGAIAPILTAYLIVVFVPLSTPPLLENGQVLDPVRLAARLTQTDRTKGPPTDERLHALWPPATAGELDAWGETCRALLSHQQELRSQRDSRGDRTPTEAEASLAEELNQARSDQTQTEILRDGLNELLRRPDLFRDSDIASLRSVEREALNLLELRSGGSNAQGASPGGTPLTEQQTLRLNRLLLEAVYPSEIGKLYVRGWRPVVIAYGLAGIAVAGVFWFCFRSTPAEDPRCNAAERELIAVGKAPVEEVQTVQGLPLGIMLRSRSLWMSSLSQFGTNVGWLFLVTFLARYLVEVHQVPILERSWMAAVPPIAGIVGMFLGGRLTDRLTRQLGLRWGRALPMAITRFFAAASYLACLAIDSPWGATIAFACVFFFVDLGVSAVWAFAQDVGGRNVGSVLGWGNMWGNIGAAVAPQLYNAVLGESPKPTDWDMMFLVCAGMFVLSGVAALGIDATIPIRPKATDDS